jgi:hypothetical protein
MDFIDPQRKWTRVNRMKLQEAATLLRELVSLKKEQDHPATIARNATSPDE